MKNKRVVIAATIMLAAGLIYSFNWIGLINGLITIGFFYFMDKGEMNRAGVFGVINASIMIVVSIKAGMFSMVLLSAYSLLSNIQMITGYRIVRAYTFYIALGLSVWHFIFNPINTLSIMDVSVIIIQLKAMSDLANGGNKFLQMFIASGMISILVGVMTMNIAIILNASLYLVSNVIMLINKIETKKELNFN